MAEAAATRHRQPVEFNGKGEDQERREHKVGDRNPQEGHEPTPVVEARAPPYRGYSPQGDGDHEGHTETPPPAPAHRAGGGGDRRPPPPPPPPPGGGGGPPPAGAGKSPAPERRETCRDP